MHRVSRRMFECLLIALLMGASGDWCKAARVDTEAMRVIGLDRVDARSQIISKPASVDSKLRSAYLLRACVVEYELNSDSESQLHAHFSVVLQQLVRDTESSLDLAVQRWQRHAGCCLTSDECVSLRGQLRVERSRNLVRLAAYQARGLFPQNRHFAFPVPVFVDNRNTACAVGHLMRESGWSSAVELIARTNNFVYVTDVSSGPVFDWILQSGLTYEEAALIQPGYGAPDGYIQLIYDPANGGLILDSGIYQLTALEIQSPEGYFRGAKPEQLNGLFDVFNPHKLFVLKPAPYQFGDQSFGAPLQAGLNGFQTQTLKVAGAVYPSGTFRGYCINSYCVPEPTIACSGLLVGLVTVRRCVRSVAERARS